jgi:hypothetical protein
LDLALFIWNGKSNKQISASSFYLRHQSKISLLLFHLKTEVIHPPKRCGMFDMRGYTMSRMSFAIMKYVSDQIQRNPNKIPAATAPKVQVDLYSGGNVRISDKTPSILCLLSVKGKRQYSSIICIRS